ncbi:DUF4386 domain-containing protein, partial [Pedobacter sp. CCM 8938]
MNNTINRNRSFAKLSGYSLLLMAVIAGFSFGYALPKIFKPGQLDFAQSNLSENLQLYKFMLLGILIVLLLDILVSFTLYIFFKNDNKKWALLSCILRIIYSLILGIALYYLAINIGQSNNSIVLKNYKSFQNIWSTGLIVFGIHLLIIGALMKLHKLIPGILWYLSIIAGASYILIHLLKTTFPQLTE